MGLGSIDKYSKEANGFKVEESSRWAKRFKEANRRLESLKDEIAERKISDLDLYLQKKNSELEVSKLTMKTVHANKINSVYQIEMENWYKIVSKASEIIQGNFLLLRSTGELDSEMLEKLQTLAKLLQGQRNVKFADDDQSVLEADGGASGINVEHPERETLQNIMNLTDFSPNDSPVSNKKRNIEEDCNNDLLSSLKKQKSSAEDPFIRPKALKSINFDQQITNNSNGTSGTSDMNITFNLAGASGSKATSVASSSSLSRRN